MPRIFDNIDTYLNAALRQSLERAYRADFCVGYFNLRGWKEIDVQVEAFDGGDGRQCRLLVGMSVADEAELRQVLNVVPEKRIDQRGAIERRKQLAASFRRQLCFGVPTDADEQGLRRLLHQLRGGKLAVKLFTAHPLHAKLYLAFREDADNPAIGYVGSSNLTFAGLGRQGELNVDVLDHDAAEKLAAWFDARWEDQFAVDITRELIAVIEESWAREEPVPPYHIYLKMAYVLSQEARTGIAEEVLPEAFERDLFPFQKDAVKIAARGLKEHGGVLIGDVVGLGKTITATAVASLFSHLRTLVICPRNLVTMWKDYVHTYDVNMEVMPITQVNRLARARRYQLVIIDESHNLRNREAKRYAKVKEYIEQNDSKVILLSATPYNKDYRDLSNQLRLFIDPEADIGMAPEALIREHGPLFLSRLECRPRTLRAFEHSDHADDWRELMSKYLVRRTRSFIKANHARLDPDNGRRYLLFSDGRRSYFPERRPVTLTFPVEPSDPYARLYANAVVSAIAALKLPRYGLGQYDNPATEPERTPEEQAIMENLSRAGKRLMGFCRTGLFKRLESSGQVFIQSIERHILRNHVFLYAIENNLPLPIGSQAADLLDWRYSDEDPDADESSTGVPPVYPTEHTAETAVLRSSQRGTGVSPVDPKSGTGVPPVSPKNSPPPPPAHPTPLRAKPDFRRCAQQVYTHYRRHAAGQFTWIESRHFLPQLADDLAADADGLIAILRKHGDWDATRDAKLACLKDLIASRHPHEKILVFTQFADTAAYLADALKRAGHTDVAAVTGNTDNLSELVFRFSPVSNDKQPKDTLRVLIATDVLSEGQNLQDAHIVVNYDLPWAIIRLIQRAGRVDRIGQKHDEILCYSFLPADGVERLIRLRSRVRERLTQNAEVVGSDEAFFEDQADLKTLEDLFHAKPGTLDGDDADGEVDLVSEAYQIWKNAIDDDPRLQKIIPALPDVVYSARPWPPRSSTGVPPVHSIKNTAETAVLRSSQSGTGNSGTGVPPVSHSESDLPAGVLVFMQTGHENSALAWMDTNGRSVTESQFRIMRAARCAPDTPAVAKADNHHALTAKAVELMIREKRNVHGTPGTLGSRHGIRFRTYELLKHYLDHIEGELFDTPQVRAALQEMFENPLTEKAKAIFGQHLKLRSSAQSVAQAAQSLYQDDELVLNKHAAASTEPRLICSLGLRGDV